MVLDAHFLYLHNEQRYKVWLFSSAGQLNTGSSRKSVKSKFVCTGINFHKKWILWGVLGSEIATNLSSTSTRSVFRFTGCIALWTARTTRWTRPGKRLTWPPARFFQNLQKWSKSGQKCPKVSKRVLEWSKSIFQVFRLLPVFWITSFVFSCFKKYVSTLGMRKG